MVLSTSLGMKGTSLLPGRMSLLREAKYLVHSVNAPQYGKMATSQKSSPSFNVYRTEACLTATGTYPD